MEPQRRAVARDAFDRVRGARHDAAMEERNPRDLAPGDSETSEEVERDRVLRRSAHLRLTVGIGLAFLLVAALKPWALVAPQAVPPPTVAVAATTVSPGPPSPATTSALAHGAWPPVTTVQAFAADLCRDPGSWLVVDDDVEFTLGTRTWTVAASTNSATGPGDAAIPVTYLTSEGVRSLGFCAPTSQVRPKPGWHGTLWRIEPGKRDVAAISYDVPAGRAGVLLSPSTVPASEHENPAAAADWPPGLYVLQARVNGSGTDVWLAIDIVAGV